MRVIAILVLLVAAGALPHPARADYFSLWTETVVLPGDGLPSSYIGDFDDDGQLELVGSAAGDPTLTEIRDLRTGNVEHTFDWVSIYDAPSSYTAFDIDQDGTHEILIPGDGGFRVVDWLPALDAPSDPSAAPTVHSMDRARPNPFNPRTTIAFELGASARVDLAVFDPAGRLVRRLVDEELAAGAHESVWDGRDSSGRDLASGTYYYTLTVDGRRVASNQAVLLK
jgi:hypothetical protein